MTHFLWSIKDSHSCPHTLVMPVLRGLRGRWRTRGPKALSCLHAVVNYVCRLFSCMGRSTHHDDPLMPVDTQNPVVTRRAPSGWVNKDQNVGVDGGGRADQAEHVVKVAGPEKLLRRVKAKPGQLALDKVGAVSHHIPEPSVPRTRLPPASTHTLSESAWPYQLVFDMETENSPRNQV